MTFDKTQYWVNRKEGKRGQEESPVAVRVLTKWIRPNGDVVEVAPSYGFNRSTMRRRVNSTKRSKYNTKSWAKSRQEIAERVANREAVAMQKAHERQERRKAASQ